MRTRITPATVVLSAILAVACGNESTPETTNPPPPEVVETHAEEENAIHLNEDMVRDLRISTATVLERPGAGEVTVLGEVVADASGGRG